MVEAAGNGGQNLDDAIYDTNPVEFPAELAEPVQSRQSELGRGGCRRGNAARQAPTVGTLHPGWGDVYADRGRCFFSNYGARVDAQGWGWEVTTTGYGDLQGGC